jgi:hypothetical protein
MRDVFEAAGYDPDDLVHPKDVDADDLTDESVVVAYTVVRNPDPDAPRTTYDLDEFPVQAVVAADDLEEYTDGKVRFPKNSPVPHGVHWAFGNGIPKIQAIGYGTDMYGPESDFEDPHRWDRLVTHVRGRSDDFIRFKL